MRLLNLILTILASRRPSTERPFSPHLIQKIVCIIGLAVATAVLGSALLLGIHVAIYFVLTYNGVDPALSLLIVSIVGIISFAIVIGELVYKVKHFGKDLFGPSEPPSMLSQLATAPEAFLQGLMSKSNNRDRGFF